MQIKLRGNNAAVIIHETDGDIYFTDSIVQFTANGVSYQYETDSIISITKIV